MSQNQNGISLQFLSQFFCIRNGAPAWSFCTSVQQRCELQPQILCLLQICVVKTSRWLRFDMFLHPAWVGGSYSNGPPSARSDGTKSTGGFYHPELSPCSGFLTEGWVSGHAWADTHPLPILDGKNLILVNLVLMQMEQRMDIDIDIWLYSVFNMDHI